MQHIVAVDDSELDRLDAIYQRGQQNGVRCEMIGPQRLAELEPSEEVEAEENQAA